MDGQTLPAQAKRGRPAKNAAIYDDNGTLLLSEEEREELNSYDRDLNKLFEAIERNCKSAVQKYLDIGAILNKMEGRTIGMFTAAKSAQLTGLSENRVSLAKRIYNKFGDNPQQIEGMTIAEIMPLIAKKNTIEGMTVAEIMPLIAKKNATEKKLAMGQIQYAAPVDGGENIMRECFGIAPLSGAELHKYRVRAEPQDGRFYLLQEGFGAAIPIASLSVDEPKNAEQQAAFRTMQDEIQCAMERYYAFLENDDAQYA